MAFHSHVYNRADHDERYPLGLPWCHEAGVEQQPRPPRLQRPRQAALARPERAVEDDHVARLEGCAQLVAELLSLGRGVTAPRAVLREIAPHACLPP